MHPDRWQEIERLYHAALEIEPESRGLFLSRACSGDEALLREVESLLTYDSRSVGFIERPALELTAKMLAAENSAGLVGQNVGSYRILSRLGAGGMGEVYLAEDSALDRKVAIKFLSLDSIADEQARLRLVREAQAAARLEHPSVCAIHEVGEHESRGFIVMQYVEGETLAQRISRGRLSLPDALDVAGQIAAALDEAHGHAIVHRDIKPQNIMLTARGHVKVLDFGLAKVEHGERQSGSQTKTELLLTRPGTVPGTVPYMSPEQLRAMSLDGRTDLFSLGVVLYEMITGKRPFSGSTSAESIAATLDSVPEPLAEHVADVPPDLQRIVSRCLEKDRELRYASAREMAEDLARVRREMVGGEASTMLLPAHHGRARLAARPLWIVVAAVVLAVVLGLILFLPSQEHAIESVAVLPFASDDSAAETEYLGDGIAESVINRLSELPGLKVISSASSFKYRGRETDPVAIGRDLKVSALISGKLVQRGDTLFVSVALVDASDNRNLWGEQYSLKVSELPGFQDRISRTISQKLRLKLTKADEQRLSRRDTENPEAYQLYLKGRFYWGKLTPDGIQKAIDHFQQAIDKDPDYAVAYAGLADCYSYISRVAEARNAATEALRRNDSLGEAHASLGWIKLLYDWDWAGAETEIQRGIDLNPNYATAHHWYAVLLANMGRNDEALREAARAQELDPLSLIINITSALAYVTAHRYDEAVAELQRTLEMDPTFLAAHSVLGLAYDRGGRYQEAVHAYTRALELSGNNEAVKVNIRASLARVYADWGKRSEAAKILREISLRPEVSPYLIAEAHAALGETKQAFEWLDRAIQTRDVSMLSLKTDPAFARLQNDPHFGELLRRTGLEP